MKDIFSPW